MPGGGRPDLWARRSKPKDEGDRLEKAGIELGQRRGLGHWEGGESSRSI